MMIVGARTVAIFLFPLLGLFIGEVTRGSLRDVGGYILLGAVIGILGPQWILSYIRKRYNAAVNRGTPDAIDLLVVCSEAGMGLESALERVAEEMHLSNPQIAKVLTGLIDDLRVLPNRRDAFDNLAKRSTENGLRRFGIMVNQSLQYGTPLSHALRAIAEELRKERLIKLEERAHKLAVKLTLPMVFFMLPAMFITLGGSSFLHLIRAFSLIGK
jgi:tight adherence protein C